MEYFFICPYCGEEVSMVLDLSVSSQKYAEDCEVCCNPIEVEFTTDGESVTNFQVQVMN